MQTGTLVKDTENERQVRWEACAMNINVTQAIVIITMGAGTR